jgi:putative component of toxin-antitoxin plasmid stabilization module
MAAQAWQIEIHEAFDYASFLSDLSPQHALAVSMFIYQVAQLTDLKRAPKSWIKPLKAGLFEFRISSSGALVRVFFTYKKRRVIMLLGAYDKGSDPSKKRQQQEIAIARLRMLSA